MTPLYKIEVASEDLEKAFIYLCINKSVILKADAQSVYDVITANTVFDQLKQSGIFDPHEVIITETTLSCDEDLIVILDSWKKQLQ